MGGRSSHEGFGLRGRFSETGPAIPTKSGAEKPCRAGKAHRTSTPLGCFYVFFDPAKPLNNDIATKSLRFWCLLESTAGPVQLTQLEVSVKDSTCWVSQSLSFATRTILGQESSVTALGACKSLCRSDPHCAHLSWNSSDSTCYSYGRLCFGACEYERIEVEARYASCGERTSCLNVSVADHFYLSGAYCPYGETAVGEMHGQAFLKIGRTEQDGEWRALRALRAPRGSCVSWPMSCTGVVGLGSLQGRRDGFFQYDSQ